MVDIVLEQLVFPEDCNIILGQSHFIKTVEDLYEVMANSVPGSQYGIAFSEASGPCLIRKDGNENELIELALENLRRLG
ncbi:MAG TPA: adenosine-specific kinase, partial [Candidatus Cloacimonadota bacterium]|nr:adenosine-specific kinase [Candidatus Cloacimonadota bacterium]